MVMGAAVEMFKSASGCLGAFSGCINFTYTPTI